MKKKLLYIVDRLDYGGAGKVVSDLINYFNKIYSIKVLTLNKIGYQGDKLRNKNIDIIELIAGNQDQVEFIIRNWQPAIIHSHSFKSNRLILNKIHEINSSVKIIIQIHGMNKTELNIFKNTNISSYEKLHKLIFVSRANRSLMIDNFPFLLNKTVLIPNGVNIKENARVNKKEKYRFLKHYLINPDYTLIGSVGALKKRKGFQILIDAIFDLINQGNKVCCVIAGLGTYEKKLNEKISNLGLENKVKLIGYIDKIELLYNAIDYFIFPSFREGLPLVILEAMAAGKIIITTNIGGIPEIISDHKNGFLIKSKSKDAIVEKYSAISRDEHLKYNVSIHARNTVIEKYDLSKNINNYKLVYDE